MQRTVGASRFDLLRRLGAGGMGVVYEARDRKTGERLAIKTLHDREAGALYRLKKEFRGLQNVVHPNLIQFRELFEDEGEWFLVMEFVDGCDARVFVRGASEDAIALESTGEIGVNESLAGAAHVAAITPPRDYERVRDVVTQIATALDHLHAHGRLHCDVKPSNVIVDRGGRAVLLDFGLARLTDVGAVSSREGMAGTVPYVSPEQVAGAAASEQSDCYALGVLLFELLTGRWPFAGSAVQILQAKCSSDAPTSLLAKDTPDDLRQLCVDLLRREPSLRPTARHVLQALTREPAARPSSHQLHVDRAPFFGRVRELATLDDAFEQVREGNTRVVWMRGASGVGKTTLVRHFFEEITSTGNVLALAARCYEREDVPFKALDGIIDTLSSFLLGRDERDVIPFLPRHLGPLCAAFPVLERVPAIAQSLAEIRSRTHSGNQRDLACAALREMLIRLGERHLLVIFIDDLQWGDVDSMRLLGETLRPPDAPAVLVILGSREDPTVDALFANLDAPPATLCRLDVRALENADATMLAQHLLAQAGVEESTAATTICSEAKGHPLHMLELVKHAASVAAGTTTLRLDDAIAARIGRLPARQRAVLRLVCLSDGPLVANALQLAASVEANHLLADTTHLTSAHLLKISAGRGAALEPFHDRVREIVCSEIAEADRRELHRALAQALEESGGTPERLAHHWAEAGEPDRAATYAEAAARRAIASLAFDRGAEWFATALTLGAFDEDHRRALWILRADALTNAGHPREAGLAFLEASRTGKPGEIEERDLRRRAAERLLTGGYLNEGIEIARQLLADVGLPLPATRAAAIRSLLWYGARVGASRLRWRARPDNEVPAGEKLRVDSAWSTAVSLSMVDSIRGSAFVMRTLLLALGSGEPTRIAVALAGAAFGAAALNQKRRLQRLTDAIARSVDAGTPEAHCYMALAEAARANFCANDWLATRTIAHRGAEAWTKTGRGHTWEMNLFEQFIAWANGAASEFRAGADHVETVIRGARRRGDRYLEIAFRTQCPHRYLLDDAADEASRSVEEALDSWNIPDGLEPISNAFYWGWRSRLQCALYSGRAEADAAVLDARLKRIERSLLWHVPIVRVDVAVWAAALSLARAAEARRSGRDYRPFIADARRREKILAASPIPVGRSSLASVRAVIANFEGNHEATVAALRHAIATNSECQVVGGTMGAQWRLGRLLGGDEGAAMHDAARSWFVSQGAVKPERMLEVVMTGFSD